MTYSEPPCGTILILSEVAVESIVRLQIGHDDLQVDQEHCRDRNPLVKPEDSQLCSCSSRLTPYLLSDRRDRIVYVIINCREKCRCRESDEKGNDSNLSRRKLTTCSFRTPLALDITTYCFCSNGLHQLHRCPMMRYAAIKTFTMPAAPTA